ncbi:Temperature-sensitive hemagglutinin tsh autotransporter precursor [Klebsiella pneumoniae]|nr:Temperature-sensitive hemagglutinin tsh autotransporter precursor [Klebsiella pneumoniae]
MSLCAVTAPVHWSEERGLFQVKPSVVNWSLTARAGLHYEFDLTDSADIHLQDTAGEHHINGGKDSRMLYGVGLNARLGDNIRFGLGSGTFCIWQI